MLKSFTMDEKMEILTNKLAKHTITEEEREELNNRAIDMAMEKYIIGTINNEQIPFEKRIKNIYQAIQYCSGHKVDFPHDNFYETDAWKDISKKIRERDKFTCQICKATKIKLNVHHIFPKSIGGTEEENNLITLCSDCHGKMPKSKNTRFKIEELKMEQSRHNLTKKQEEFVDIFKSKMGLISNTCRAANLSRAMYYRWLSQPPFKEAIEEAKVAIKDFGEAALYKSIDKGDVASIIFFNKTKNRDRGYQEREVIVNQAIQNNQLTQEINLKDFLEKTRKEAWMET